MDRLLPLAEKVAARLTARGEKIAIAESSTGGLIAASLLALPGASAYFLGGAVVYTMGARTALLGITDADMKGMRAATEPYAALAARCIRESHQATWGLAETGASGSTGNRYGDPPGHSCFAIVGPRELTTTLLTGTADRQQNMRFFAARALELLEEALGSSAR